MGFNAHALATKQPRLKSGGLQSVVANARVSLQENYQKRHLSTGMC